MVVPAEVKSEEVVFDANLSALIALIGGFNLYYSYSCIVV